MGRVDDLMASVLDCAIPSRPTVQVQGVDFIQAFWSDECYYEARFIPNMTLYIGKESGHIVGVLIEDFCLLKLSDERPKSEGQG